MASRQQILTNSRTKGGNPPQSIYNPSRRGTYEGAFAYAPAGLKGDKDNLLFETLTKKWTK